MPKLIRLTVLSIAFATGWGASSVTGQVADAAANAEPIGEAAKSAKVWTPTRLNASETLWSSVTLSTNPATGVVHERTNTFTALAGGLNYKNEKGEWTESREEIELFEGGAVARQAGHKVVFAQNINTRAAIQLTMPGGQVLKSHVIGLAFTDAATGQSVLIAEVKDSVGAVKDNLVLYADAFDADGFTADLKYTFSKDGLEQDVVIREKTPKPSDYGLSDKTSRLEVWTEFVDAPVPEKTTRLLKGDPSSVNPQAALDPALSDETLRFGEMTVGEGTAFPLDSDPAKKDASSVQVGKEWAVLDAGRTFLIEKTDFSDVVAELEKLPKLGAAQPLPLGPNQAARAPRPRQEMLAAANQPPERDKRNARADAQARPAARKMEMAAVFPTRPGYVVDYALALSTSLTSYRFLADQTYLVMASVTVASTVGAPTIIEGGTVIKYTNSSLSRLLFTGPVECRTAQYRPAYFVAMDDNSVGDVVSNSSGSPGHTQYAARAIDVSQSGTTFEFQHLRFRNCKKAVVVTAGNLKLSHSQITRSGFGLQFVSSTVSESWLFNVLLADIPNFATYGGSTHTVQGQHLTVHRAGALRNTGSGTPPGVLNLVNCLLTRITNAASLVFNSSAGLINVASDSGLFVPLAQAGFGEHYLAATSGCLGTGVNAIDPALALALKNTSTQPPLLRTGTISQNTIFAPSPSVPRNMSTTANPDIGYAYDVMDFLARGLTVSGCTLLVTNGAVVGLDPNASTAGIHFGADSQLVSMGTPTLLNRFLPVQTIQEAPLTPAGTSFTLINGSGLGNSPNAFLRFTEMAVPAGGMMRHFANWSAAFRQLCFQDSQFLGGEIYLSPDSPAAGHVIGLTNSLFERVAFTYHPYANAPFHARNNLFKGGYFRIDMNPPGTHPWTLRDNLFDGCYILQLASLTLDANFNAYVHSTTNSSRLLPVGINDRPILTASPYPPAASASSRYYLPVGETGLTDNGSSSAALSGLYNYTTRSINAREGATQVDIGLHYVAVENGSPVDSDSDGLPDYVEDQDGNGSRNGNETSSSSPDTDGDGLTDYQETSILKGLVNPLITDTDGDGMSDADEDLDHDLLSNYAELNTYSTDPMDPFSVARLATANPNGFPLFLPAGVVGGPDTDAHALKAAQAGAQGYVADLSSITTINGLIRMTLTVSAAFPADTTFDIYLSDSPASAQNNRLYYKSAPGQRVFDVPIPPGLGGIFTAGIDADTDGDGMSDGFEVLVTRTGVHNPEPDTDRDLLPNSFETTMTATSPTLRDTGSTGVPDSAKDLDGDGLSNLEEFLNHTDPLSPDIVRPIFDPPPGSYATTVKPRLITPTPGAIVRYTLDGTEPTVASSQVSAQDNSIAQTLSSDTVVKARAWKSGFPPTTVTSGDYRFSVSTPSVTPNGGPLTANQGIKVSCATPNVVIRYTTDGTEPTATSLSVPQDGNISLTPPATVKVRAWKNARQSGIASAKFYPSTAPLNDSFASPQSLAGTSGRVYASTSGATSQEEEPYWRSAENARSIWFTYDSTSQQRISFDISGSSYGGNYGFLHIYTGSTLESLMEVASLTTGDRTEGTIDVAPNTQYRLCASHYIGNPPGTLFLKWGLAPSVVATPTLEPSGGTYRESQAVEVYCATPDGVIRYTTSGNDPTELDPQFLPGTTITVRQNLTLKVKCWKHGILPSAVTTASYIINPSAQNPTLTLDPPTVTPASGSFGTSIAVNISHGDPTATLRYTLDGSRPSQSSASLASGTVLNLADSAIVGVRAYKSGWNSSRILTTTYAKQGRDTDLDGLSDEWELQHGSKIFVPDANAANDEVSGHGIANQLLYENPTVLLSDNYSSLNDGVPDWWKVLHGYDIITPATTIADNGLSLSDTYIRQLNPKIPLDTSGALPQIDFGVVHGPGGNLILVVRNPVDRVFRYRLFFTDTTGNPGKTTIRDIAVGDANRATKYFPLPGDPLPEGLYQVALQGVTEANEYSRKSDFVSLTSQERVVCEGGPSLFECTTQVVLEYRVRESSRVGVALYLDSQTGKEQTLRQRLRASSEARSYGVESLSIRGAGTVYVSNAHQWWGVGAFAYSGLLADICTGVDPYFPYLCYEENNSIPNCYTHQSDAPLWRLGIRRWEQPDHLSIDPDLPVPLTPNGLRVLSYKVKQGPMAPQILTAGSVVQLASPAPSTDYYIAQEVEQPILLASKYYFDGRTYPLDAESAGWWDFGGSSYSRSPGDYDGTVLLPGWVQYGTFGDIAPIPSEFPLILAVQGRPTLLNGWSEHPIRRSDGASTERSGWIELDFDAAFLCDPATGDVPRTGEDNVGGKKKINVTAISTGNSGAKVGGLLSPSIAYDKWNINTTFDTPIQGAEFTPTNTGKYIIKTKTDQYGNYGEQIIYAGLLESQDRFLHGAIPLSLPIVQANLSIKNITTGQDFGTYANVLDPQTKVHVYGSDDDIFSEAEVLQFRAGTLSGLATDQAVVFVKDASAQLLHFYAVFDGYGDIEVRLKHSSGEFLLAEILKPQEEFSDLINHLNERVDSLEMEEIEDPPLVSEVSSGPDDWGDNGMVAAQQPGTMFSPGGYIGEAAEGNSENLILVINDDNDDGGAPGHSDLSDTSISALDNDIVRLTLRRLAALPPNAGTLTLTVSGGAAVRLYRSDGLGLINTYSVNLATPSGDLAGLAAGMATVFVEGVAPNADVALKLTYRNAAGVEQASDEVHLKVVARTAAFLFRPLHEGAYHVPGRRSFRYRLYSDNGRYRYSDWNLAPVGILERLIHPDEPMPIKNRNLLIKSLIASYKLSVNVPISLAKGIVDGIWDGIRSDIATVQELWRLGTHPFERTAEIYNSLKDLLKNEPLDRIGTMLGNALDGLMTNAEKSIFVGLQQEDFADAIAVRAYCTGYTFGFICEQIAVAAAGVGIVNKVGAVVKGVMAATKTGVIVLSGATAIMRFKGVTVAFAKNWIKSTRGVKVASKAIRDVQRMVDRLAKEVTFGGKSAAEILATRIQSLHIVCEEIAKYCDDLWNDVGFRACDRLAGFMEVVMGRALSEAELRGFLRVYGRLFYGNSDHYDKMLQIFRTGTPTGRQRLGTALADYANPMSVPDPDLLTLAYAARKDVGPLDHPELLAFKQRVEILTPYPPETPRVYEGVAIVRYERLFGKSGLRRPTAADIPSDSLRFQVDYLDPSTPGEFLDVKGPILTNAGEFESLPLPAIRVDGLAASAINKIKKNNGLVPPPDGLSPPLPTKVVVDLFGLSASEAQRVVSLIQASGLNPSYFIILGNW